MRKSLNVFLLFLTFVGTSALILLISFSCAPAQVGQSIERNISISNAPSLLNVGNVGTFTSIIIPLASADDPVRWSSDNPSVLSVDAAGQYTALTTGGPVTITATIASTNISSSAVINVLDLQIENAPSNLATGANGIFAIGPPAFASEPVTWASTDASVLSVDAAGQYTAHRADGPVTITATIASINASVSVVINVLDLQIENAPSNLAINASGTFAISPPALASEPVTWISNNPSVLSVDILSGQYTAHRAGGPVTITATIASMNVSSSVNINVVDLQIENARSILVTGASGSFAIGPPALASEPVTWISNNPSVLSVDSSGQYTALTAGGPITITATIISTNISVSVVINVLDLQIENARSILATGASGTLAIGPPALASEPVTWASSDASVLSVDSSGRYTALTAGGPITITATLTSMNVSSSVDINVLDLQIENAPSNLAINTSGTFTIGPPAFASEPVTWVSNDPSVLSVDSSGRYTAHIAGGPVTITAILTSMNVSSSAVINVLDIRIGNAPSILATAASGTFTISPSAFASEPVTWISNNPSVLSVDAVGQYTALTAGGPVTITATITSINISSSVDINVLDLQIENARSNLATSANGTFAISPSVFASEPIEWASSDASVLFVDSRGLYTTLTAGGPVTITATLTSMNASSSVVINVLDMQIENAPSNLAINASGTLAIGPPVFANEPVTWISNNPSVLSVDATGQYTAHIAGGPVKITAILPSMNASSSVNISVVDLQIENAPRLVEPGNRGTLTISPPTFASEPVTWMSNNPSVLSVDSSGQYTAHIAGGPVTITATLTSMNISISVVMNVVDLQIGNVPDALSIGTTGTLSSIISPSSLTNESVTWASNDPSVLSINMSSGQYFAHIVGGPVTITATIASTNISSSVDIGVYSLQITSSPDILNIGDTGTLTYQITPQTQQVPQWTSGYPSVISIDTSSGEYVVHSLGNNPIVMTVRLGSAEDTVEIQVFPDIQLSDVTPLRVEGASLANQLNIGDKGYNALREDHTFSIYPLPIDSVGSHSLKSLSIQLDGYSMDDLESKGFFLIASSAQNSASDGVQPTRPALILDGLSRIKTPPPRKRQASNTPTPPPFDFATAVEYDPEVGNNDTASTRTFLFHEESNNDCSTLFKKTETIVDGKEIKIAFWIDRNGDSERSENGKCNDYDPSGTNLDTVSERNALKSLDFFAEDIFTSPNSAYRLFKQINNSHFWDSHVVSIAAAGDSVLHIGIGDLRGPQGFVDYSQFFRSDLIQNAGGSPEEIAAPTVYMNIDLLKDQSTGEFFDPQPTPYALYSLYRTFTHELQHLAAFYARSISSSGSSENIYYYLNTPGSTWFSEFISLTSEYLLAYKLFDKILERSFPRVSGLLDIDYLNLFLTSRSRNVQEYNHNVFFKGINTAATDYIAFTADNYEVLFMFAAYLINNYGIEFFQNIMKFDPSRTQVDEIAIINAVKDSPFYLEYDPDHRPESFEDIIHDFHVATFLSVPTQSNDYGIGPHKMLNHVGSGTYFSKRGIVTSFFSKAPTNGTLDVDIISYNLASTPNNENLGSPCTISPLVNNCMATDTYAVDGISPEDTGIPGLSFNDSWFGGSGPVLTTLETERRELREGKADFIFLGGKFSEAGAGQNISLSETTDQNGVSHLRLHLSIPKQYQGSLIVVEAFHK